MLPEPHEGFLICDERVTPRSENPRKRLLAQIKSMPSFPLFVSLSLPESAVRGGGRGTATVVAETERYAMGQVYYGVVAGLRGGAKEVVPGDASEFAVLEKVSKNNHLHAYRITLFSPKEREMAAPCRPSSTRPNATLPQQKGFRSRRVISGMSVLRKSVGSRSYRQRSAEREKMADTSPPCVSKRFHFVPVCIRYVENRIRLCGRHRAGKTGH
jgi:hypothetical protein